MIAIMPTGSTALSNNATLARAGEIAFFEGRSVLLVLLAYSVCSLACVVEQIDALIEERGVTYCPTSTADSDSGLSSSTSTSTTTDTTVDGSGSEASAGSGGVSGSDSSGSESSTGPSVPVCGDGVVEGDETCDDGNLTPGDGCQECAKDSVVFITSEVYQGFALGGLDGADQRCRVLAAKAGLQHPLTFKAWLSISSMSASDRLLHSSGRYVLVNGLLVAQNWDALTSGALETPLWVDENAQTQDWGVWTGTLASGQSAQGSEFCENWDDDSGLLKFGGTGLSANTDDAWSFFDQGPCDSELRLYCVEQ